MDGWRRGAVLGFGIAVGFLLAALIAMGGAYWYVADQRARAAAAQAEDAATAARARQALTSWILMEDRDAITDAKVVVLMRSLGTIPNKGLAFRCMPGSGKPPTIMAMLGTSVEQYGRSDTKVIYRLGAGAPVEQTWFTRRDTAFTDWKNEVEPVISGILGVDRITIRATAYDGSPADVVVMTDGLAPKLEEFRKRCS